MLVSVILPTYNQFERLLLTLTSLSYQTCGSQAFEVIVVDDGSTDSTLEAVHSFVAPYQLRYIRQDNLGRAVARNHGAEQAEGELLLFNDSDRAVCRSFIEAHLQMHGQYRNRIIIGSIYEFYLSNLATHREALLSDMALGFLKYGRLAREYPYARTVRAMFAPTGETTYHIPWISFFSGNVSLFKKTFSEVGGFDEAFVDWGFEHFELGYRLYTAGLQYYYAEAARNFHFAHLRDKDLFAIRLRTSFDYFLKKHPHLAITLLEPFLRGQLALQDYEAQVTGTEVGDNQSESIYFTRPVQF